MKFGPVPVAEAEGAVLAHTQRLAGVGGSKGPVFKKGRVLSAEDVARLTEAGTLEVIVARLEQGDVGEDAAALQVARALVRPAKTMGGTASGPAKTVGGTDSGTDSGGADTVGGTVSGPAKTVGGTDSGTDSAKTVGGTISGPVARALVRPAKTMGGTASGPAKTVGGTDSGGADTVGGTGVRVGEASTGRCNLFATRRGVVWFEPERVHRVNGVDPAITLATVAPGTLVEPGEMVATVKIIPFAVSAMAVAAAAGRAEGMLRVAPLKPHRVGLVLTRIDGAESVLDRASRAQHARVEHLDGRIVGEIRCDHDERQVAQAMRALLDGGADLILALGASAICDRRDVIPSAVDALGGEVLHFGMPVDPGNLLLLARKGDVPILGVPGCARSLKRSGFDAVLERLVARIAVSAEDITRMGAGGLLAEIPSRPRPRRGPENQTKKVAAVVLAAGRSSRMGSENKLLMEVDGQPMVTRVVDAMLAGPVKEVVVVTGHDADAVRHALGDRQVRFVHNPDYAEGMSTSLKAGIEALASDLDGALVALGDMPFVRSEHVKQLIDALHPSGPGSIVVPVHEHRRGHPVLWAACHFRQMRKLSGDVGAKALLAECADQVREVQMADTSILVDIDTRQAWESMLSSRES